MPVNSDPDIVIRKYCPQDRAAIRRICCETALMGEPASAFFDDYEALADALTKYFTDYEPESCFIAESKGNVVGYLTGAVDSGRMSGVLNFRIAPFLVIKALLRGAFFRKKNIKFFLCLLLSLFAGEFFVQDPSKDYPALLHINVDRGFRASGTGSMLMQAYISYLKVAGIKGVHCATMSESGGRFFESQGFAMLFKGKRSYFRHVLKRDVPLYIYGKRL